MRSRIYTDTSVLGGCEDEEFAEHSVRLMESFARGEFTLVLSSLTVLSAKMRADAQHIAMATVGRVDVLVSWNFRHIVNLERIHGYNSVNLRKGYPMIEIRTPREVSSDE
jgi:hypothetical protein